MPKALLEIKNLTTCFFTDEGPVKGCDGVSFKIHQGETLAVVGESGSGKSVMAMSILNLIPSPPGEIVAGEILFEGRNLLDLSPAEMRRVRGNQIAMIFQEPMTSLNPVITVGKQIGESLRLHRSLSRKAARESVVELLDLVGIPAPEKRVDEFPYQLSGGMRQRVMIAMALACRPKLLIADEPTSALDVTIQAQIIGLVKDLQKKMGMAVILITHDMSVVAESADKVAVMYAGRTVEYGTAEDIFYRAKHPYLEGLKRCIPSLDAEEEELHVIDGIVPDPLNLPPGCRFESRCAQAQDRCREADPPPVFFGDHHYVCCWLHGENAEVAHAR
ncbi:MAG: ABC transporter ATP-binding protein [Proteobacteria bacterium]|nr:ABC transporter ATP-binding protein [Pseudomonadota bacterium]